MYLPTMFPGSISNYKTYIMIYEHNTLSILLNWKINDDSLEFVSVTNPMVGHGHTLWFWVGYIQTIAKDCN